MNKKIAILFLGMFLISLASATLNVSLSDQGTDVTDTSSGELLASGDLTVTVWDALSGGNLIYNETFTNTIINGSWNVMLGENSSNSLSLEYGKIYYKDYEIDGEDASFTNLTGGVVGRQFFYSPLGDISDEDISDSTNLTLGEKITFAFNEVIDNIVDGWITITGGLNVTENVTANYFIGDGSLLTGISGNWTNVTINENLNVDGDVYVNGSFLQAVADPVFVGELQNSSMLNGARSVYVSGKYAYVAVEIGDRLAVIDISDPTDPILVGELQDGITGGRLDGAYSVYVSGEYAYATSSNNDSFQIIDVSNPSTPVFAGQLGSDRLDGAYSVYVSGKYAYVTAYVDDSLQIIDISDASAPVFAGELQNSSRLNGAWGVYVSGGYAYVTSSNNDSFQIIDVSNPSSPSFAGQLVDSDRLVSAKSVYVSGKYAYVTAYGDDSLQIIDISNASAPVFAGELDSSSRLNGANSVYVSGKYAYVATRLNNSLKVIDISNASAPVFAGELGSDRLDGASSVYVSGKYAYVASESNNSLQIIDIGGIDVPSANIGDLAVGTLDVWENADVKNDLYVGSGLVVGIGGIYSQGDISASGNYSHSGNVGLTGNYTVGNCWQTFSGGIMVDTNCTAV
jgi:hypothetical protein